MRSRSPFSSSRYFLTALLQFFTSYAMAMLAFWVLEVSTFIFILFAFEYIASGHLFPLDILPPALEQGSAISRPFPYQTLFSREHLHGQNHRRRTSSMACRSRPSGLWSACLLALFAWRAASKNIPPWAASKFTA